MAQVKIEDVIDHLDSDIRKALEQTIKEVFPNQPFNSHQAFRIFVRMVRRKCNTWETVPDGLVKDA
ncbi:MAG TPA: hypothetical protein VL443_20570 [Cyclobacteriaceae bacterium]|jgi:hypothetical protein|nr:hypothetical protein [Cyclobacteriaceae bacterium]